MIRHRKQLLDAMPILLAILAFALIMLMLIKMDDFAPTRYTAPALNYRLPSAESPTQQAAVYAAVPRFESHRFQ